MKNQELIEAIQKNDAARVAALLDEDRSLLKAKAGNVSAILLAIYHGHPEMATLFVDRGADPSFGEAVALGDADRARRMLESNPSLLHSYTEDGYPAAGLAIFFRHPALARELIERGADVNAAARNEQRLKEFLKRMIEPVESVEVQAPRNSEMDALKIKTARFVHHPEASLPQALSVIG